MEINFLLCVFKSICIAHLSVILCVLYVYVCVWVCVYIYITLRIADTQLENNDYRVIIFYKSYLIGTVSISQSLILIRQF